MAGYRMRALLIAQSLNQIEQAYGPNSSILDNCHVRVAFAPNDERTARRLSETLGTATEVHSRSEEHTSELQSLMRISYAVFCLNKKKKHKTLHLTHKQQT